MIILREPFTPVQIRAAPLTILSAQNVSNLSVVVHDVFDASYVVTG